MSFLLVKFVYSSLHEFGTKSRENQVQVKSSRWRAHTLLFFDRTLHVKIRPCLEVPPDISLLTPTYKLLSTTVHVEWKMTASTESRSQYISPCLLQLSLSLYATYLPHHHHHHHRRRQSIHHQGFPAEVRPLCTSEENALLPDAADDDLEGDDDRGTGGSDGANQADGEHKTAAELARLCYEDPCLSLIHI